MEIVTEIKSHPVRDNPIGGEPGVVRVGGKSVKTREFLEYIRAPKRATVIHSDGSLYLSGLGEWDCSKGGHKRSNTERPFCMNCWVDL